VGGDGLSRRLFLVGGLVGGLAVAGSTVGAGRASANETTPPFTDCAAWAARPPRSPVKIWAQRPVKILVHHTASANQADVSRDAALRLARTIQGFHMDRRGWIDSGQHLTISRGGVVLEGRHRSLEVLAGCRSTVEGAHCTGQNVVAIGIENEGTYTTVEPPAALWDRLRETCAYICRQYGIRPTEIYGHRDFKNTACPGDKLYAALPRLRDEVAGLLGPRKEGGQVEGGPVDSGLVKASWPLLRPGDSGADVLAAQLLLRSSGAADLAPSGTFDAATDRAVRAFQAGHGADDVNGLLGGESWPVLVAVAGQHPGADVSRALDALSGARQAEAVPDDPAPADWQRLLGTGGAPADLTVDPPGTALR
jgi:N-acetylmuramoyl-L-alanine amidase/Putative peptidoglycan binding domain